MSIPAASVVVTRNRTMRSAVLAAPRRIEIREVPIPQPQEGQVRIRLQGCGVCGSNLEPWKGRDWFTYPFEAGAPGHEGWGVVDAVGVGAEGIVEGMRVAFLSSHAFAEYDVANASDVVPLPRELDSVPFPGEPLACAMNVMRRARIGAGETVAVVGCGFLGTLVAALAAAAGARVIAIARRPFALELAKRFGAAETILMDDHWPVVSRVKVLTGDKGCDCVIEAAGAQWPLDLASEITSIRGRLVIAGYHQDGLRQVNMQLWNWRGIDVINAHERDPLVYVQGLRDAIEAVRTGRIDPLPLYTHPFRLDELGDALGMLENHPDNFMKGILVYE